MCGACYSGFADVAGTSAPFAIGGVAVARHRWKLRFGRMFGRHAAAESAVDHTILEEPVDEPVA